MIPYRKVRYLTREKFRNDKERDGNEKVRFLKSFSIILFNHIIDLIFKRMQNEPSGHKGHRP